MSHLPPAPWTEVSTDFGHLPNGKYMLVVTDEYSCYVIVDIIVISTSARWVIRQLKKNLCWIWNIWISEDKQWPTIQWPENNQTHPANAETECFMQTGKKSIRVMHAQGLNYQQENYQYLLAYRTTPTPQLAYHLPQHFWDRIWKTDYFMWSSLHQRTPTSANMRLMPKLAWSNILIENATLSPATSMLGMQTLLNTAQPTNPWLITIHHKWQ